MQKHSIRLTQLDADKLSFLGNGNVSRGVREAVRMSAMTDGEKAQAIRRHVLECVERLDALEDALPDDSPV